MKDKPLDPRFDDPHAHIEPISDADAEMSICVILAAHGREFPQLRGPGVARHQTDEARHLFAARLVDRHRESRMGLYRTVSERSLMMNTGMANDRR